ncbi:MAG: hypothetical protein ACOY5S_02120, partial [Pseudomonadota bacterium]
AAALPCGSWSPRLAISIFSNMVGLRGKIALTACGRRAIWPRRCAALRQLVAAVGDKDFFEHVA